MLAKRYEYSNPRGYWMSHKMDGVRAIYDGTNFISRNGKTFPAPESMKRDMPKGVILDGELYGGIGTFQKTVGKVRRGDWQGLRFMIFDLVADAPTEARQATLKTVPLPSWCEVVEQIQCTDHDHLEDFEDAILEAGGEGVMLRKPGSRYVHGRSDDLLKLKRSQTAEARVIGYAEGKGKHVGRVGALIAKYQGKLFKLGTGLSNHERETPPRVGELVTFSFFELTDGGKPRFPVFLTARNYE